MNSNALVSVVKMNSSICRSRWPLFFAVLLFLPALLLTGKPACCRELHFFCGSVVKMPMDEIVSRYEKEKGITVKVTYGGSGTLLSQMELSHRGDLYLSGSPDFIVLGEEKGLLVKGSAQPLAWLIPALIVSKGNPAKIRSLDDLTRNGVRVGMGNPESVCLGLYGVELLQANNLLKKVLPRVKVFAKSCEDVISLVLLKSVDVVIGWDICASWNPKELELVKISPEKIPRIAYIAVAVPVSAKDRKASDGFITYLRSAPSREIFRKWGYITAREEAMRLAPASKAGGRYALPDEYYRTINHEK